jgi:hypothetical protein
MRPAPAGPCRRARAVPISVCPAGGVYLLRARRVRFNVRWPVCERAPGAQPNTIQTYERKRLETSIPAAGAYARPYLTGVSSCGVSSSHESRRPVTPRASARESQSESRVARLPGAGLAVGVAKGTRKERTDGRRRDEPRDSAPRRARLHLTPVPTPLTSRQATREGCRAPWNGIKYIAYGPWHRYMLFMS